MKLLGIGVILALCVIRSQQNGMNDATKAIYEAREKLRHTNPMELLKNVSEIVTSVLPEGMVHSPPKIFKEIALNVIRNAANPANIRTFLHLVRESKMKKKGEIIRMTMRFMNPDNLRPEGLIHTFQSLDDVTVSELSAIFLEFTKILAPQVLGDYYDHFAFVFNYINPNDFKEISKILFDIFKETDAEDIMWAIDRAKEELSYAGEKTKVMLTSDGDAILNDYKTNGMKEIQEKVKTFVRDAKKIANFEKFSPHVVELTAALKTAFRHLVELIFDDLKNHSGHIDLMLVKKNSIELVQNLTKMATALSDFIDFGELGTDTENTVVYLKRLNHTSAKNSLTELKKFIPSVSDIMDYVNHTDQPLIKINRNLIATVVKIISSIKLPEVFEDTAIDIFLYVISMVNEKLLHVVIDFLVQESQVDNKIYTTFKAIAFNILHDSLKKYVPDDFRAENWADLKKLVLEKIDTLDEGLVDHLTRGILADIKHVDSNTITEMINEANSVVSTALSQDLLKKALENPKDLLDVINKTVFTDIVTFNLNAIKLINSTQVVHWCKNLSTLAGDELNKRVDNVSAWIEKQFDRVENGKEVAHTLKIHEATQLGGKIVKTLDLSMACDDIASVLKLNRVIGREARQEGINLLWSAFSRVKRALKGDVMDQKMIQNIQEVLNAMLRVLLRNNGNKGDVRTGAVRLAIRSVDDYVKTGRFRLVLRKSEAEELAEKDVEQSLAEERAMLEDYMEDTIVPFDITKQQMPWTEKPLDVMLATSPKSKTTTQLKSQIPKYEPTAPETTTGATQPVEEFSTTENIGKTRRPIPEVFSGRINTTRYTSQKLSEVRLDKPTSVCEAHLHEVIKAALENKHWARKMMDGWLQMGPSQSAMGHTCSSLHHPKDTFNGFFCQANVSILFTWHDKTDPEEQVFVSGVCIPSTCTPEEFGPVLNSVIGQSLNLNILSDTCQTPSSTPESQGAFISRIFLGIIFTFVVAATLYELAARLLFANARISKWLKAFSLDTNVQECFTIPEEERHISVIYGIRGLGLIVVIAYCTLECIFSAGILTKEEAITKILFTLPLNLYAATDVMLFTGGALAAMSFRLAYNRKGSFGFVTHFAETYFRWIYCIGAMILIRNGFSNTTSDTPTCNASWWHHVLFIENIVARDQKCLPQSWYLSLELQLFLATPLVMYVLITPSKVKWIGAVILSAILTTVPMVVLSAINTALVPFPSSSDPQFTWDLVMPYTRAVPWLVGIVIGDIIQHGSTSDTKHKISNMKGTAGVIASVLLYTGLLLTAKQFTHSSRQHWQIAVYLGLSRFGVSMAMAGIAFLGANGFGGWLRTVATSKSVNILGRLSLCAFIVHMAVVELRMQNSYTKYAEDYMMIIWFIGDYVMTQVAGLLLCLFIELPAKNVTNIIYGNNTTPRKTEENIVADNNGLNQI